MSTDLKAIPTEYKGVRFRSKSEAIFARCLDASGCKWEYEPSISETEWPYWILPQHPWDFSVKITKGFNSGHIVFVEYKPVCPSITYLENLAKKIQVYMQDVIAQVEICDYLQLSKAPFFAQYDRVKEIADKHGKSIDELRNAWFVGGHSYCLVYGSPFSKPISANGRESYVICPFSFLDGNKRIIPSIQQITEYPSFFSEDRSMESVFGITEKMAQEALTYRFDLKH